jgi:hyperosmotically inducible protein
MYRTIHAIAVLAAATAISATYPAFAQQRPAQTEPRATQPDNTSVNKADREQGEPTADQQKETREDRDLAQKIRRSLTSDKSLSTYAHNVKVIVQDGVVTLKGPVRSEEERSAVEAKAKEAAGSADIRNELTIAAK